MCFSSSARLGEMTTSGYTLLERRCRHSGVHVHAAPEELGRGYRPALAIIPGYAQLLFRPSKKLSFSKPEWRKETESLRKQLPGVDRALPMPGKLQYGEVIKWLSSQLPEDAIRRGGAGNFAGWLHRHFRYKGFRTQLGSTNGSMGYGYPAAVAAKLAMRSAT